MSRPYTPSSLADEWGCSERHIVNVILDGKLPAFTIGPGIYRINAADAAAYDGPKSDVPVHHESKSVVYIVRCNDYVKLGVARGKTGLAARIREFETSNPYPIHIVAVTPGTMKDEAALHHRFRLYHRRGEWFRLEGDLADYIAGLLK